MYSRCRREFKRHGIIDIALCSQWCCDRGEQWERYKVCEQKGKTQSIVHGSSISPLTKLVIVRLCPLPPCLSTAWGVRNRFIALWISSKLMNVQKCSDLSHLSPCMVAQAWRKKVPSYLLDRWIMKLKSHAWFVSDLDNSRHCFRVGMGNYLIIDKIVRVKVINNHIAIIFDISIIVGSNNRGYCQEFARICLLPKCKILW